MSETVKLAAQEQMKIDSQYLKGNILEDLADDKLDISDYSYELLKFHGSYFGHNRDTATPRKKAGLEKEYEFMIRTRVPGGRMSAQQYLGLDEIASKYANETLRITTRQTIQYHVILKSDVKAAMEDINKTLISTQSACGDVVRNVCMTAAPIKDVKHERLWEDTQAIAAFVKPKTTSYDELWNDRPASGGVNEEPLYGQTYLPRKFKIGVIFPEDNSVDVFTHDLGFVQIWEGEVLKGYNVVVGGGMGMKHEAARKDGQPPKTFARVADTLAFIEADDLLNAVEAVVKLQRDHGDRTDRQHARLKYVIAEKGLEWMRSEFESYFAKTSPNGAVQDAVAIDKYDIPSHMGWHEQGDGKLWLGLPVPSGRIMDYVGEHPSGYTQALNEEVQGATYRKAIKELLQKYEFDITLTPTEEIIFRDVEPSDKADIEAHFTNHGIKLAEEHTSLELNFMACVSLPTCAKALAESERVQFPLLDSIQAVMDKHGVGKEKIAVRVTGCPNGCARPYVGDIGIVGRMPGHYVLFIGGDFEGTRLNTKILDKVPQDDVAKALDPMFALYAANKNDGEGFGDFVTRYGIDDVVANALEALEPENYKWAKAV